MSDTPESVEAQLIKRGIWLPGMDLEPVEPDSFLFVCPVCRNEVRQREPMEPACTGPSWRDEHPMVVMRKAA